ncbi:9029_t:CDS:2, partial [Racocetra persica]
IDICNWWTTQSEKDLEKGVYLYPIRVGCQVGLKFSDIEKAPSPTITFLYRRVCQNNNTNFSGLQVLGWDDPYMLEQSLTDIEF